MTLINPIYSEWKSVGLELTIPMMYHTQVKVTIIFINPNTDRGVISDPN